MRNTLQKTAPLCVFAIKIYFSMDEPFSSLFKQMASSFYGFSYHSYCHFYCHSVKPQNVSVFVSLLRVLGFALMLNANSLDEKIFRLKYMFT